MFLQVEMSWNILIPPKDVDPKGPMLQKAIMLTLSNEFANRKGSKDHGYFVALNTLDSIGEGKVRQECGGVLFPVVFTCLTFKPFKGEILHGVVKQVMKHGVLLSCGPIENVFISAQTMPNYQYVVSAENPVFVNDKFPKIEKSAALRFTVLGTKWIETQREFQVLGTLAGDFLGPV